MIFTANKFYFIKQVYVSAEIIYLPFFKKKDRKKNYFLNGKNV